MNYKILLPIMGLTTFFVGCTPTSNEPETTVESVAPIVQETESNVRVAMYTLDEVSNHSSKSDCWTVIDGGVYDVTSFIDEHEGGLAILKACGKDATQMFMNEREHQENNAAETLPSFKIGEIAQ